MRDKELYARIVSTEAPWRVTDLELNLEQGEVVVRVEHDGEVLHCPQCGQPARPYDTRRRRWRHLGTCQYRTILVAELPWVHCERYKVKQVAAPWSESRSRLTALFEAVLIDWLREASIAAVAEQMGAELDEGPSTEIVGEVELDDSGWYRRHLCEGPSRHSATPAYSHVERRLTRLVGKAHRRRSGSTRRGPRGT